MAGGINLATKYIKEVDERWVSESQAALVTGKGFAYKGDETFVIYSIPYAPLNNYTRQYCFFSIGFTKPKSIFSFNFLNI